MQDTTTATAPDHEALLSTVETAGAALVAALEACVAAGLPVGSVDEARRVARTDGARAWLAEQARPKGPMVTISKAGRYDSGVRTWTAEVGKITEARIILHSGTQFRRDTGEEVRKRSFYSDRSYITPDEIARIVATGWAPPKAPRASKASK